MHFVHSKKNCYRKQTTTLLVGDRRLQAHHNRVTIDRRRPLAHVAALAKLARKQAESRRLVVHVVDHEVVRLMDAVKTLIRERRNDRVHGGALFVKLLLCLARQGRHIVAHVEKRVLKVRTGKLHPEGRRRAGCHLKEGNVVIIFIYILFFSIFRYN